MSSGQSASTPRYSEEQFQTLANSIPQLAWMADSNGWVFWYNQRWYDYTGTSLEQMQGWGWCVVHHPDHVDRVVQRIRHSWETGTAWEDTFPLRSRTGEWRWFLSRALPIRDDSGQIVRWFGTNTDVTDQLSVKNEGARLLQESEQSRALLDALFENAPVGLCFWDEELRYTRLNSALAEINGLSVEAHLGKTPEEILPGLGVAMMALLRRILHTGETLSHVEVSGQTPASPGVQRTWLASFYPVHRGQSIMGLGSVMHEITDRKRTERELRSLSERLEQHLTNSPVAVVEFDHLFRVVRWSPWAERIFGWTSEEVIGRKLDSIPLVHEEDAAAVEALLRTTLDAPGSSFFNVNRNYRKDGSVVHVEWYNSVYRDEEGRPVSVLSFGVDVTARTQAEASLHQQAEALARSNAELQQFAYAAGHDLQEPLRMVALYNELLRRRYAGKLDSQADIYIEYAVQGAHRMEAMIRDLLAYSKLTLHEEESLPPAVSCDVVLRRVLFTLEEKAHTAQASIHVLPLPMVRVQEVHLIQLFQNLLSNAIKYHRAGVPPCIEIAADMDGAWWVFRVSDNGIGVAPQYQAQIFELFKRLHPNRDSGTGIGLTICQKIVERYGGSIGIESEGEGKGSTFVFTLPAG